MAEKLIKSFFSFEFEVFGKVQGKFRKKITNLKKKVFFLGNIPKQQLRN